MARLGPSLRGPRPIPADKSEQTKLVNKAKRLIGAIDRGFVRLGRVLDALYDSMPHGEFRVICKTKLRMSFRRAWHLIIIARAMRKCKIPVNRAVRVGWTKLSMMSPVLTKKNWTTWFEFAEKENCSTVWVKVRWGGDRRRVLFLPLGGQAYHRLWVGLRKLGAVNARGKLVMNKLDQAVVLMTKRAEL